MKVGSGGVNFGNFLAHSQTLISFFLFSTAAKIHDRSMEKSYSANTAEEASVEEQDEGGDVKGPAVVLGQNGLLDLTDFEK